MSETLSEAPRLLAAEIAAAILAAEDITIQLVATPEWPAVDGHVYVRTLSGRMRDRYVDSLHQTDGSRPPSTDIEDGGLKLAAAAMCDQAGATLFTVADVIRLREKNSLALQRIMDAAADLNAFSDKAKAAAKNDSARATT